MAHWKKWVGGRIAQNLDGRLPSTSSKSSQFKIRMATPTLCSSAAATPRLPPPLPPFSLAASPVLPGRLCRNIPLLRVPTQRRGTFPYSSVAMTSATRFLILDDPDDPLDFGAIAGAAFLPLRRCAEKRKRAATPEVVKVRAAPPEVVEVRSDGGGSVEEEAEEVKTRPAKKGLSRAFSLLLLFPVRSFNSWRLCFVLFLASGQHLH